MAVRRDALGGSGAGLIGGGHFGRSLNGRASAPFSGGFRNPNLPTIADITFNGGNATRHILAPSRRSLENKAGGILSRSEVRSRSKYTLY